MCSNSKDCLYIDTTTGLATGNKCGDPNGNCVCLNGTCTTNSCSADNDCSKFGDGCVCANGTCSCEPCQGSADCPYNMECAGNICTSIRCTKRSDCPDWSVCSGSGNSKFCTKPTIISPVTIFILILVAAVMCVIGYYTYREYKK